MALAITHFAVGFAVGYTSDSTWYAWLCGLFAMIPDANQIWPSLDVFFLSSPWSNSFFLHGIIDNSVLDTEPVLGATLVLCVVTVRLLVRDERRDE